MAKEKQEAAAPALEEQAPVEKQVAKSAGHVVAAGISVTSLRGIIDAGEEVSARDFGDGKAGAEAFADLVARGAIVSRS